MLICSMNVQHGWIEKAEDPKQHDLYKVFHIVTNEMISEIEEEIALGVF